MIIRGFQKLTLLDFPGKTACTVFTGGCNFRCPFCHNASLVLRAGELGEIPESEVLAHLKKRAGIIDGLCITGGEPLLNRDIGEFISKVRELGCSVKLDTNGSLPRPLISLVEQGLVDYVAMDVKAGFSDGSYGRAVGVKGFDTSGVLESIEFLKKGKVPFEFRTTAVKGIHTARDFEEIAKAISGDTRYYIQSFKDSGDLIGQGMESFSRGELEAFADVVRPFVAEVEIRGI